MARFLNTLILTVTAFALIFCWFYYYTKLALISCLCAFLLSFALCLVIFSLQKIKGKKYKTEVARKKCEQLKIYLTFSPDNNAPICTALREKGFAVRKVVGGYIVRQTEENAETVNEDKVKEKFFMYVNFGVSRISEENFSRAVRLCKKYKCINLTMFAYSFAPTCKADNLGINLTAYNIAATYKLLEESCCLPVLDDVKPARKLNRVLTVALCKQRSGAYLTACISLVLFSVISFYPVYTLFFATVQLFLAIYSKFNKRYNTPSCMGMRQ